MATSGSEKNLVNEWEWNGKVYSLTFIHESKYNFSELCFKGYKILRPENTKFKKKKCILQLFSFCSSTYFYLTFFYPHYAQ